MTTCLDCVNCKIKFPVNKKNSLETSLSPYPKGYRSMTCKENQWIDPKGNRISMLYSEQNIQIARLGNSRYLNQADRCNFFKEINVLEEMAEFIRRIGKLVGNKTIIKAFGED